MGCELFGEGEGFHGHERGPDFVDVFYATEHHLAAIVPEGKERRDW
jgi:hypothetical protein